MARYHGNIGFIQTVEAKPGTFREKVTEREAYGDVLKYAWNNSNGVGAIDNYTISNRISVVANPALVENLSYARYVVYLGTKWEISSVDVELPRLIFTLGGVYNSQSL